MSNDKNNIKNNEKKNDNLQIVTQKTIIVSTAPEYEIFYSEYGYIKILKEDILNDSLKILKFNSYNQSEKNNLNGFINKNNIKSKIKVKIKLFLNDRNNYTFENIDINSDINILFQKIVEKENELKITNKFNINKQYRIFSCHCKVHQININNKFYEEKIYENETLLIFNQKKLFFSEILKNSNIILQQNNSIALKKNTDSHCYVLGDFYFENGKNYFEINLITDPFEKSVLIGLATKKEPKNVNIFDVKNFYGYLLSDCKKYSRQNYKVDSSEDYGEKVKLGDNIGVLCLYNDDGVDIGFFLNKKFLGLAYKKLSKDLIFYPACLLGYCNSKIKITNDVEIPHYEIK
jgi:hypothetical protein